MKKTLIALAVIGAAGVAQAQSNVTIYGTADINYTKQSGSTATMSERKNNRLGFMGSEDLGGGLKATFQLEERFKLFNGVQSSRGVFEGAANAGLAGGFGSIKFGRLNEISTETLRKADPFDQYGIAGQPDSKFRGQNHEGRLSSAARWDSMDFNGFKLAATYGVKNQTSGVFGDYTTTTKNDGYAIGATYTNGPLFVLANYNQPVDSNKSSNWNVGGIYAFGPAKVSASYEKTTDKTTGVVGGDTQNRYLIGLAYSVGAGVINASYNYYKWDVLNGASTPNKDQQYGIGYTHNLSKRTGLYANYARDKQTADVAGTTTASTNKFEVGITHNF